MQTAEAGAGIGEIGGAIDVACERGAEVTNQRYQRELPARRIAAGLAPGKR